MGHHCLIHDTKAASVSVPSWLSPRNITRVNLEQLMRRMLTSSEPQARKFLLQMWRGTGAVLEADIEAILNTRGIPQIVMDRVSTTIRGLVEGEFSELMADKAGQFARSWANGAGFEYRAGEKLATTIAERASRVAVDLAAETRKALMLGVEYYTTSFPVPAGTLAERLRWFVGLTERESKALNRLATSLAEEGVPPLRASRMVAQYSETLTIARAQRIARTEISFAATKARQSGLEQAIEDGVVRRDRITQVWSTSGLEGVVCPICESMDGQERGMGEQFYSDVSDESYEAPPAHPHCMCVIADRVK